MSDTSTQSRGKGHWTRHLTQETIVLALTVAMFAMFSFILDNFFSSGNVITLLRSVSVLGMLGLGMAITVIGRGVDLSMVATMVVGIVWSLKLHQSGMDFVTALIIGAAFAIVMGMIIGIIVAYAEIPAVFTTLAMGPVIFGIGNVAFFTEDTHNAPADVEWLRALGFERFLGVPASIYILAASAFLVFLFLRYTRYGRSIYAIGDNMLAARHTGFPVRPMLVGKYVLAALIAFMVGLIFTATNSGINTRLVYTTLVYDVLLVVVLGGIGLSGGKGGVRNVIVGTLFVGVLLNGMTIMNLSYTTQNFIKSLVMLVALIAETMLNPRDEQTSQSGDI
ncbi:ABC transporter permease [Rhodovulum sp. FJ3]|uniref:ABC transporter permease n=1 Tax=Rhodovulum sp. FJ3 TaxID=3079053 RepID=UPI00294331F9|nr:ABC transporter permease [Rhodovulum sp. FJ3]